MFGIYKFTEGYLLFSDSSRHFCFVCFYVRPFYCSRDAFAILNKIIRSLRRKRLYGVDCSAGTGHATFAADLYKHAATIPQIVT